MTNVDTGFFVDENLEEFEFILIKLIANSFDSVGLLAHGVGLVGNNYQRF